MTDKPTVTHADMGRAAKASGFSSWEDAIYWSNLAKQSAVSDLANEFAAHREAAIKEARELLEAIKQQCLFVDDDGTIGVSSEPYINHELFERICALTQQGAE